MADEKNNGVNTIDGILMEHERYINPYTEFGFKKLFEQAEIAKYTPEERREYEVSVKNYWDYYSTMTTAMNKSRAEGMAEGMAKGIAEGAAKANRENARKMKKLGSATDFISQITGLSAEEIEKL